MLSESCSPKRLNSAEWRAERMHIHIHIDIYIYIYLHINVQYIHRSAEESNQIQHLNISFLLCFAFTATLEGLSMESTSMRAVAEVLKDVVPTLRGWLRFRGKERPCRGSWGLGYLL